jgi:hypothetical protein
VYRVNEVKVPDLDMNSPDAKRIAEALQGAYSDELLAGYGERLEKEIGWKVNDAALSQVTGGGSPN